MKTRNRRGRKRWKRR